MTRIGWTAAVLCAAMTAGAQAPSRPVSGTPPPQAPAEPAPADAAAAAPADSTADVPSFGDLTVITADRLVYDGLQQYSELEGRVVVSDPELKMKADKVRIEMAGTNEVRRITATGHVVLSQADKQAWAGRATYDVAAGKFVLEENPRVMRGRDMMMGDRITFWRDQERLECWPNARLIVQPDPERKGSFLKGMH